jgi:hypothetical protein
MPSRHLTNSAGVFRPLGTDTTDTSTRRVPGSCGSKSEALRVTDLWLEVILERDMPGRCGVAEFAERVIDHGLRTMAPARGEGTGHDAPANPTGLLQRRDRIREVPETEGSADDVEGLRGERKVGRVGDDRQHGATRPTDGAQHAFCDVDGNDLTRSGGDRGATGDAGARTEVEHPGTRHGERRGGEQRRGQPSVERFRP